jgi:hypothetical protein
MEMCLCFLQWVGVLPGLVVRKCVTGSRHGAQRRSVQLTHRTSVVHNPATPRFDHGSRSGREIPIVTTDPRGQNDGATEAPTLEDIEIA